MTNDQKRDDGGEPLFILLAKLAEKDGDTPITKFPGCWERQIGESWWIAVNAHKEEIACSKGMKVKPINCYVEFNGWPAGVFTPYGGVMVAGAVANEESFAAAVDAEIASPMLEQRKK